jgi:short-subunit dehydrogenase
MTTRASAPEPPSNPPAGRARDARFHARYGPWAVVTGASAGIGRELARAIHARGVGVVLAARREPQLRALAAELPVDLAQPGGVAALVAAVGEREIGLVAHAAGFGHGGPHVSAPAGEHGRMLAVNCGATLELLDHYLPGWIARRRGGALLLGSVIGYSGVPYSAHYAATKAYVMALGEALQVEARPFGVDIAVVAPGPTRTEFLDLAGMRGQSLADPTQVATTALAALGRTGIVIPDRNAWAIRCAMLTAPRALGVRIMGRIMAGMTGSSPDSLTVSTPPRGAA